MTRCADPATGRELLHGDARRAATTGRVHLPLGGRRAGARTSVDVRPVGVEQSNTSIVFGDELIMKAIRRIEPGVNPELELLRFLTARGFPHIAALAGWYEVDGRHCRATLGILQEFLAGARDGWELALDELATDPEGLLDRLEALGVVIGELHTALGSRQLRPGLRARRAVRPRRSRSCTPTSTSRSSASSSTCPRPRPPRRSTAAARTCARSSRALARDRRRPRDPHPRRPAPRPDDARPRAAGWCSTSRASRRGRCPSGA